MSDYISKRALIEELKNTTYVFKNFGRRESVGLGEVVSTIDNQPTLNEKEIIRKAFERVVERLENIEPTPWEIVKIVKEECGINE